MAWSEKVLLRAGLLEIDFSSPEKYRLSFANRVVYENGRRIVNGKSTPYGFRSVEQLRYDFEKDLQDA